MRRSAFLALLLAAATPSCWMFPVDPAPTLDVVESPTLLARASGSVVVADGTARLRLVSLPSGRLDEFGTSNDAIVASGLDDSGRVVFVRMRQPWFFADAYFDLVLKSLVTGQERELCEIGRESDANPGPFVVDLAAGRAMSSFKARKPRIFDVETGRELEIGITKWERRHSPLRLSDDGKKVLCSVLRTTANESESLISFDLESGATTEFAEGWPIGFGPESDEEAHLPGCSGWPCTFVGDSLAVYEGLASPASHPRSWFSLAYPGFERSIRIADTRTDETATLVPRYRLGSFRYGRFDLPPSAVR